MASTTSDQQCPRLLNREDAAKRLGISVTTLDRLRYAGLIHDTHVSRRRVMIEETELKRYLTEMAMMAS